MSLRTVCEPKHLAGGGRQLLMAECASDATPVSPQ